MRVQDEKKPLLYATLLCALTLFVFFRSLNGEFLDWDDSMNFLKNEGFRGLGLGNLEWAFSASVAGVYQPLAWLLFELEYVLFGLAPRGYHAVSILLHCANGVLLFYLIYFLLRRTRSVSDSLRLGFAAFVAALFFAVHPLRTEVVSWLSCQPYLLCSLWYLGGLYSYCRYCESKESSPKWLALTWALFLLALLAKSTAVSFPIALLLLDGYLNRGLRWREKIPFFIVDLIFMGIAIAVRNVDPISGPYHIGFTARIFQSCYAIVFFLAKTVFPLGLTGFYPIPPEGEILRSPVFIASLIFLIAAIAILFAFRRRSPSLWAATIFYVVVLLPNLGIITFSTATLTADRYSYISCFAWFALMAYAVSWCLEKHKAFCLVSVAGVSLFLSAITWRQQEVWKSSASFWTHAWANGGSHDFMVNEAMGKQLSSRGKSDEALDYYQRALDCHPSNEQQLAVMNSIAIILRAQGKLEESMQWILRALAVDSGNSFTRNQLGIILNQMGFLEEAIAQFQKAVRLKPDDPDARANLQDAVRFQKSLDADIVRLGQEVKSNSSDVESRIHLGAVLGTRGRLDDAIREFRKALALDPTNVMAQRNLSSGIELRKKKNQLHK